jgi:hypothetical protein
VCFVFIAPYHVYGDKRRLKLTNAKIQISVGAITFSGEGTEDWLEKQLDKLLASAPSLAAIHPSSDSDTPEGSGGTGAPDAGTLPTFLQKKAATKNHVRRFLATAEWLHLKGSRRVQTSEITKALSGANQPRLGNPADCLNKNVAKGHCEKEGKTFFVTPEGKTALG